MRVLASIAVGLAIASPVAAQPGSGAAYGSRDAHTCGSTKAPGKGAPSEKVVTEAILCSTEHIASRMLYLVEDLKFEIAPKGRPYNPRSDLMTDIDTDVPIYSIQGSLTTWQCSEHSDIMKNQGKNCNRYDQPKANGRCYKSTFGDWKCSLYDLNSTHTSQLPPPKSK
jgi:hypothetical protein